MQRFLDEAVIIEPDSLERLTPEMGERYLRALPATLSGFYVAAVLVE